MGNSIAAVFTKIIDAHKAEATLSAMALTNQSPFQNELVASDPTDAPDPTDLKAVRDYFNREEMQKAYVDQIEQPSNSKISTAISAKVQSDVVASVERDYRTQNCVTRVRSIMLEASRRQAHGEDDGPVSKGLAYYPQYLLSLDGGTP